MKSTSRISLIAAGVALACGLGSTAAHADAVAQSILNIENFHFAAANGAGRNADGTLLPSIALIGAPATTADSFAKLNGSIDNGSLYNVGGQQSKVGASGSYVPGAVLAGSPTANYAASTADQFGNSLLGSSYARTDGLVSLKPGGDGSTQGNVNFQADFKFTATAAVGIEIAFDANAYVRAYSTGFGNSTAAYSWVITLVDSNEDEVFRWSPDGSVLGVAGGTEYADGFSLTNTRSTTIPADKSRTEASKYFEAETNALTVGETYTVSIRQVVTADALLKVPEPASMALLGLALSAAGVASRRRSKK